MLPDKNTVLDRIYSTALTEQKPQLVGYSRASWPLWYGKPIASLF